MAPSTSFVIQALNANFRPLGRVVSALFPADEFDPLEATQLANFCDRIAVAGYGFVYEERDDKELRSILDLGAEYGAFVDSAAAPWYLGIFIIAECVMEPFASDSFSEAMYRSSVFRVSPPLIRDLASFLMICAILCDRLETAPKRFEALIKGTNATGKPISQIALTDALMRLSAVSAPPP